MKVGLYIDLENLYVSALDVGKASGLGKPRLDIERIRLRAAAGRDISLARLYMVQFAGVDLDGFTARMRKTGFTIRSREKRAGQDVSWTSAMSVQILREQQQWDVCVLCSGDGDFTETCDWLHVEGKKVEVFAFPDSASPALVAVADNVTWLRAADLYDGDAH